jgi:hypothetical protein
MEVCTQNHGGAPAGPFRILINDGLSATLDVPGVPAFGQTCVSAIYDAFAAGAPASVAVVRIDTENAVVEVDETNNVLVVPASERTKCDILCPDEPFRVPTPGPEPSSVLAQ